MCIIVNRNYTISLYDYIQDILDVNTLELARQMAIAYSNLFRQISVSSSVYNWDG